jgi:branched-chain amino acid transport system ATP-binding protein
MLEIKNLDLKYGRIQVIWDLTMSIYNNEAVGIFGPNGAGKTTLISSIVGLIKQKKESSFLRGIH